MSPYNLPANLQHGLLKTESPPTDKIQTQGNNKKYKSGIAVHYKIMKLFFFNLFLPQIVAVISTLLKMLLPHPGICYYCY